MYANFYLKLVFVVVLFVGTPALEIFDNILCPFLSLSTSKKCFDEFQEEIYSADNINIEFLQRRKVCCAFNHLKDCVTDPMGDNKCKDSEIEELLSSAIGAAKSLVTDDKCQTFKGFVGDVLCLNDWALGAICCAVIGIIFGICGALCCRRSPRGLNRRESAKFVLLPTNGEHRY